MINELLFTGAVLVDLCFILASARYGRAGLILASTVNLILVTTFAPKLVSVFGLLSNVGNIFYGCLFLAINIFIERYGSRAAYKTIWIIFSGNILFVLMGQFALRLVGESESVLFSGAVSTVFENVPRVAFASIVAFLVVQHIQIFMYSYLQKRYQNRLLWLRHTVSIFVSQFLDSIAFFAIAFGGLVSFGTLMSAMSSGIILKWLIGVLATPFLYLSRYIRGNELDEA